ncbi:hypothetical protein MBLNU459_g4289t1 [Dothideomycetes sp. NU459]
MLLSLVALAATAYAALVPDANIASSASGVTVRSVRPLKAFRESAPLKHTAHTLSLTRRKGTTTSSRLLRAVQAGNTTVDGTYGTSAIAPAGDSQVLVTTIEFGGQTFQAVLDTGSSDTWMVETAFECLGQLSRAPEPESYCRFGPTYNLSSTFTQIPNENFNITYGDGEFLTGLVGYEKITLANITVNKQEVGIVNSAAWNGDGVSSGLIGLAYPGLTSVHSGNLSTADSRANQVQYNPIFTNMYEDGQVESLFSLVIERGNDTSTLALGGLPPAQPGWENLDFTSTPIEITMLTPASNPLFSSEPSYYTIRPGGFTYRNASMDSPTSGNWTNPASAENCTSPVSSINTTFPVIVDSGTTLIYVPTAVANTITSAFDPPGHYSPEDGVDVILCNATAPDFGVTIGGTTFDISAEDMIIPGDFEPGYCMSGVQDGGGAVNILGDVFLKNVIAVFDVGAGMMRFAPNEIY